MQILSLNEYINQERDGCQANSRARFMVNPAAAYPKCFPLCHKMGQGWRSFRQMKIFRMEPDVLMVIGAAWGVYVLIAALLRLMMSSGSGPQAILMLVNDGLLIPMFIFTDQFQKWFPAHLLRAR